MRLRQKMVVTMLSAATLPLVAAMTISLMHSANQVQALTLDSAKANLEASAEKLSGYFGSRMAEIAAYANTPIVRRLSWSEMGPYMRAELKRHGGTYEKLLLGLPGDGRYYITSSGNSAYGGLASFDDSDPTAKLKSIRQRDYWLATVGDNARGEEVTYVSDPMISYCTGVRQVMVASTILSESGEILGMVSGSLPWAEIDSRVNEIGADLERSFRHRAKLCLVSRRGVYMYHWDPERTIRLKQDADGDYLLNDIGEKVVIHCKMTEEADPSLAEAGRRMIAGLSGTAFYKDERTGEDMVMVYSPVRSADYSLALAIPEAELVASVADLRRSLVIITVVTVALVVAVCWVLAQRASRPFAALNTAAKRLASGDHDYVLKPVGNDEVAGLTRTFNDMTESLKGRERALRESEQRLQTILDSIQTGVIVVDTDTHLVVEANSKLLRMLEADRGQVIGKPRHDYVDSKHEGREFDINGAETIEPQEVELRTRTGGLLPVLRTVTPAVLNGRRRLLECLVDISDLKRAEAELQQRMDEETEAKRRLQVLVSDASEREKRMVELKEEVNGLLLLLGQEPKYEAPCRVAEMDAAFAVPRQI